MSRQCQISGKKRSIGYRVSHSKRQVKKSVYPNLQTKKIQNPKTGRMVKATLTTNVFKTLLKWQKAGKVYDLKELIKKAK